MTREIDALGVIIPARKDGANARSTAQRLLGLSDTLDVPVTVIVVDNGDNEGFDGGLPHDQRLVTVTVDLPGPGYARSAGVAALVDRIDAKETDRSKTWLISLDADVLLSETFLTDWVAVISETEAEVLNGPAHFAQLPGDAHVNPNVEAAGSWMWGDTALYESIIGVVNLGGTNHSMSVDTCLKLQSYLQPTAVIDGRTVIVPGEDWDLGLRARMKEVSVMRTQSPVVHTSSRRIASDPIGFLAGRSYERPFEPIRGEQGDEVLPADEPWVEVAQRGRARIAAHFLVKPLLASVRADEEGLNWFLSRQLIDEIQRLHKVAPSPDRDWNAYRTELIDMIFSPEVFELCGRISAHIAGSAS